MGLKKITVKHREIMRRMITNQPVEDIAYEMRVSREYLGMLARDPLFVENLAEMETQVHTTWLEGRTKAMDVLNEGALDAARLCVDSVKGMVTAVADDGSEKYEVVPLGKRLSSAWDVLDRTGNKAPQKAVVTHLTLQEMIITAYKERHKNDEGASNANVSDANVSDAEFVEIPERCQQ
jgi:hypothetical protein